MFSLPHPPPSPATLTCSSSTAHSCRLPASRHARADRLAPEKPRGRRRFFGDPGRSSGATFFPPAAFGKGGRTTEGQRKKNAQLVFGFRFLSSVVRFPLHCDTSCLFSRVFAFSHFFIFASCGSVGGGSRPDSIAGKERRPAAVVEHGLSVVLSFCWFGRAFSCIWFSHIHTYTHTSWLFCCLAEPYFGPIVATVSRYSSYHVDLLPWHTTPGRNIRV